MTKIFTFYICLFDSCICLTIHHLHCTLVIDFFILLVSLPLDCKSHEDKDHCLFCLLICPNFQNRLRHTVGLQLTSLECWMMLFCTNWPVTYPKSLTHRAKLDLGPVPSLPKHRNKIWLAEGSRNPCGHLAHLLRDPCSLVVATQGGSGEEFHSLCTVSRNKEHSPVCLCCQEDWKLLNRGTICVLNSYLLQHQTNARS